MLKGEVQNSCYGDDQKVFAAVVFVLAVIMVRSIFHR